MQFSGSKSRKGATFGNKITGYKEKCKAPYINSRGNLGTIFKIYKRQISRAF